MVSQTLNGHWLIRQRGTQDWFHGSVPGGVHTDLLSSGRISDPFIAANEDDVQWVAEKDWEYRRYFYPNAQVMAQAKVYLVCTGLDTLADIRLNGKILGSANNMFHAWEWEIKNLLRDGENTLDILFHSPVMYARQRQRINPMGDMNMGIRGGPHMRKTPSHFGWDWGPRLPCMGIYKDIQLEGRSEIGLGDIRYEQQHEDEGSGRMVMLTVRVNCNLESGDDPTGADTAQPNSVFSLRLRVTAPDRQVWQADAPARSVQNIPIKITNPQLWWPNGLGEPALYQVDLDLLEEDRLVKETRVLDSRSVELGLRTIELQEENNLSSSSGKSFQFVVNGVPVFCKGSNWIPADSFPSRISPQQIEHLIRSAAETNQNMLRVWGGGYYESDHFYELCDRYGIMVWQDFMFACATYPLDDTSYFESACREAVENIRRLRHHACLALWCGNNEIEWLALARGWNKKWPGLKAAHERFFFKQLPEIIASEDPQHQYWPGSPSSNDPFKEPNSHTIGDAHLWEVYHYYKQPEYYRQQNPRFVSEFGFQSIPASESLAQFASGHKFNSRVMKSHQRAIAGNPKIIWYLTRRFTLPRQLDDLAYLSQVYQAEAIRTAVEHWRRHSQTTSGALYWQLNDCWPVISWSSIDYYGRWKALQYSARSFFAPLLLSIEEKTGGNPHTAEVWVTNDLTHSWKGHLRWTLETLEGTVLEGGEQPVQIDSVSSNSVLKLDFSHPKNRVNWRKTILSVELLQSEERVSLKVVPFSPEINMPLDNPGLEAKLHAEGDRLLIHVTTRKLARFIELKIEGADLIFSDNYFDLPARRSTTIECALPDGWTVEQAQAALRVRSLGDLKPRDSFLLSNIKGNLALIDCLVRTGVALAKIR